MADKEELFNKRLTAWLEQNPCASGDKECRTVDDEKCNVLCNSCMMRFLSQDPEFRKEVGNDPDFIEECAEEGISLAGPH
jgi:hypothetical protein